MAKYFLLFSTLLSIQMGYAQFPAITNQGYYLFDEDDTLTTRPYSFIDEENSGMYLYSHHGNFGFLNKNGERIFKYTYPIAFPFNGEFALVYYNGSYLHINKNGVAIDSLKKAFAPRVYNKKLLVSRRNKEGLFTVKHASGKLLLKTSDSLVLGLKNGIVQWDTTNKTAQQLVSPYGRENLTVINQFKQVTKVDYTAQGFALVEYLLNSKKVFSIINKNGDYLLKDRPAMAYYKHLFVVWENAVYNSNTGSFQQLGKEHGNVSLFWLSKLESDYKYRKSAPGLSVSNLYQKDKIANITGTEKWVCFTGRSIEGKYLFNDFAHGFKNYSPVKIENNWFVLNRRTDSLISIPFKHVHPSGLNRNVMFVSNDNSDYRTRKWALYKLNVGLITSQVYNLEYDFERSVQLYDHKELSPFYRYYIRVLENNRFVYLDYQGKQLHKDAKPVDWNHKNYFEILLEIPTKNKKEISKKDRFEKKGISAVIAPNGHYLNIAIANNTKDSVTIELQDGMIQSYLQYQRLPGKWEHLSYMHPTDCGNSFYPWKFPNKHKVDYKLAIPNGNSRVKIRLCVETWNMDKIYSNEVYFNVPFGAISCKTYPGKYGAQSIFDLNRKY